MSTLEAFIKRHPLVIYYILTFAISCGGTPEQADRLMAVAFSLMAGPSVSGLLLTSLASGRAGLRDLIVSTTPMLVPAMTGVAFLTWFVVLTVALWVVVAAVAVANGRQLSGHQIRVRPV